MITPWMLRVLLTTVLVAVAAPFAEALAVLFEQPKRWIWSAAMAIAVALPVLGAWHPVAAVTTRLVGGTIPWQALTQPPVVEGALARRALGGISVDAIAIALWSLATLLGGVVLIVSSRRLAAARTRWAQARVGGERVFVAEETGPAVTGLVRPAIVLPRWVLGAPGEVRDLIVAHEREHLRAGDSRLLAAAVALVIAMPWNVALWWLCRRLRWAVEMDCDARVLAAGADVRAYGVVLLGVAGRDAVAPLLDPALGARGGSLERRILAMTTGPRPHRAVRALALLGAIGIAGVAACEAATPTAARVSAERRPARFRVLLAPDTTRGQHMAGTLVITADSQSTDTLHATPAQFTITAHATPIVLAAPGTQWTGHGTAILRVDRPGDSTTSRASRPTRGTVLRTAP